MKTMIVFLLLMGLSRFELCAPPIVGNGGHDELTISVARLWTPNIVASDTVRHSLRNVDATSKHLTNFIDLVMDRPVVFDPPKYNFYGFKRNKSTVDQYRWKQKQYHKYHGRFGGTHKIMYDQQSSIKIVETELQKNDMDQDLAPNWLEVYDAELLRSRDRNLVTVAVAHLLATVEQHEQVNGCFSESSLAPNPVVVMTSYGPYFCIKATDTRDGKVTLTMYNDVVHQDPPA